MKFDKGARLGPYEIEGTLGSGGMGEVYRARDTRLGRSVAIKVLPAEFADNVQLQSRFKREARVISSLAHPHICTLHDVGRHEGIDYLVMELLDGVTLSERLRRGPLPLSEVLRYGIEIADALDKAHRDGVVHRDLKPSNVMLTRAGVKVLDFGLAKSVDRSAIWDRSLSKMSQPPTDERPLTDEGKLVGTLAYMAPEQLAGKQIDTRTDIYALGNILYEMTTGERPFEADSEASLIAAILEHKPGPVSARQPLSPPALDRVVASCLAKDPDDRVQSAHDVMLELKWIAEATSEAAPRTPIQDGRGHKFLWSAAAVLLVAVAVVLGVLLTHRIDRSERPRRFSIVLPMAVRDVAVSPDGSKLAFVGIGEQGPTQVLGIQEVGTDQPGIIAETGGASYPFWSPDGRMVAFFADGKLQKVSALGGPVETICDAPLGRGGTWSRQGVILFAPAGLGIHRVSAAGGKVTSLTTPEVSGGQMSHRWPHFLPDGKHFLYLNADFGGGVNSAKNQVWVRSLDSTDQHLLLTTASNVLYAPPGFILFARGQTLMAQRFDAKRLRLEGVPFVVAEKVRFSPQVYRATFSVSNEGELVFQPGAAVTASRLVWVDRSGKEAGLFSASDYANPRISPDGKRLAITQIDPDTLNSDIWLWEFNEMIGRRFTFDPAEDGAPVWSPDGKVIAFASGRTPAVALFQKNSSGEGEDQKLLSATDQLLPLDWSRDHKFILFKMRRGGQPPSWDLALLPIDGERKPLPLDRTDFAEVDGQFSPDGRWIAYSSNESGKFEVYVAAVQTRRGKWQVSRGGGMQPRWRGDGKELFYLGPDKTMMAVEIRGGTSFQTGNTAALFSTRAREPISSYEIYSYDVSADGKQFLVNQEMEDSQSRNMRIVLNWSAGVRN